MRGRLRIGLTTQQPELLATSTWTPARHENAQFQLQRLLKGVGDRQRERSFRMNATVGWQRALTEQEVEGLGGCRQAEDAAGIPIEVLWEKGEPVLSCQPCANPVKLVVAVHRPDLWVATGCGSCPSCLARTERGATNGPGMP